MDSSRPKRKITRRDLFKGVGVSIAALSTYKRKAFAQPQCSLGYWGKFSRVSEIRDTCGDCYPSFGDITEVSIYQEERRKDLLFRMNLSGDILLDPARCIAFIWGLDTDRNPYTGFRNGKVGINYNIRLAYDPKPHLPWHGWHGYIDVMKKGAVGKGPFDTFTIAGSTVELVLPKSKITSSIFPPLQQSFNWIATTIVRPKGQGDRAPDEGYQTAWMS